MFCLLSITSWWCVTFEEGFCDTFLNLLTRQICVTKLRKSSELQTNEIALSVKSESHVALDSLRPNITPTRDFTLHWSRIHFSAEHKRRTNSFKPLLLYFRRVTLMGLNCSRQLVYNWNLKWSSANSFAIIHLCRSGAAVLLHRARYKIQTGIRPCFRHNDICSQTLENML